MKIIFSVLVVFLSLFLNHSQAQENTESATPPVHHVGSTWAPLGTKDHPVTADEYCAFANGTFANDHCKDSVCDPTDFYFMNLVQPSPSPYFWYQPVGSHAKIRTNDCITCYNEYPFRYAVIPGRGGYIIDGLSWIGATNWLRVLNAFNTWRENPSNQEIWNYLQQKIEGNEQEANLIKTFYPKALTCFDLLDVLALEAQQTPALILQEKFYDERHRKILSFSQDETHPDSLIITPIPGMEYYRPSQIEISLK